MEAQRYPIRVRMIGLVQKEKTKMFMTSVLWSDQSDIVVYRSCDDFKKLHKQMKKAFPPANHLKKSDRTIPKFKNKGKGSLKGINKTVMCLKFLEKYCSELLSCDPRVLLNSELIQFFHPKDQDLNPDFAKNSIVIMPSQDTIEDNGRLGSGGHDKNGNVTQPFVTEAYRCLSPYETKDTKNRPFKVALDENVDVLIKDKAGWWLVENEDKRLAWFPAPYLEKIGDENDGFVTHGENALYCAVKNYKAINRDEVSLEMGTVVEVLQRSDNGWWLIRHNSETGYVPVMYLQPYNNPLGRLVTLQQDLRGSNLPQATLQVPGPSLARQSQEHSRSQSNLLQPSGLKPFSTNHLHPAIKNMSRSLNVLSEPHPEPRPKHHPEPCPQTISTMGQQAPTIMVVEDVEGDRRGRSLTASSYDSQGSQDSNDSLGSDFSSCCCGSSLNLSSGNMDEALRLSRTLPPMVMDHLSPDGNGGLQTKGKITASRSDPNLFKMPTTPRVPPRPREHEILSRCTTVTRKNVSKAKVLPVPTEIASH
ncbi:NADPH oxidase organizer 1a [Hypomesus transpacificus]|uniref:NADPH oxidase organizer 1a n=1 Tax=Hypomesus transpacificus TaxID=137520 RepID=UPI001F080456|nr:NADPH oxidase organizer 1a [Hypomesus transpacificus]